MQVGDQVLKKDISGGIMEGIILRVIGGRIRVKWATEHRTMLSADGVLPSTPENLEKLEKRWEKRAAKRQLAKQEGTK